MYGLNGHQILTGAPSLGRRKVSLSVSGHEEVRKVTRKSWRDTYAAMAKILDTCSRVMHIERLVVAVEGIRGPSGTLE